MTPTLISQIMKKHLKLPILFLTMLVFGLGLTSCGSAQQSNKEFMLEQDPPFKIIEAYYQKWVAGIKEGGAGLNLHIVFNKMDPKVKIDEIYFRNEIRKARKTSQEGNVFVADFTNNLEDNVIMDLDPIKESKNTPAQKFPFDLTGNEAVISYLYSGKKQYYKISNLPEKHQISYPQSNPNLGN